jgi:hypothetical protein
MIPKAPLGVDVAALPHTDSSDTECTSPAFVRLLELVLGVVVQSEEKAAFVQDILAMDASVQIDLMAAIEKVMAHGVDTPAVMNGPVVDDEGGRDHGVPPSTPISEARSPHPRSTASTPGFRSPLHLSINADFDRVKRENAVLKDENVGAPYRHRRWMNHADSVPAFDRFISPKTSTPRGSSCSGAKLRTKH